MTSAALPKPLPIKGLASQAQASPEVMQSYFEELAARIRASQDITGLFNTVLLDKAFERVAALQSIQPHIRARMPLYGVPFAIKDNIDFETSVTTCGSASISGPPATASAAVVRQLQEAGAVCIGQTIMSEFSLGEIPPQVPWSEPVNPIMPTHLPGSSSQGSTAVVATGLVPFSMGTDTGGSIRHPAAAMGVYGLKPTNGSMDLEGVFPLSQSLDTVGPIASSLGDLETVCDALFPQETGGPTQPCDLRIGFPENLWASDPTVDAQLLQEMENLRNLLSSDGFHVKNVSLPPREDYQHTGWTILNYEGYLNHQSIFEENAAQCGGVFREHMEAGRATSYEEYSSAKARSKLLASSVDDALADVDLLVSPIACHLLPKLGATDDIERYNASAIRVAFNVSGHPSLVTPLPLAQVGAPFAVQWVTRRFAEALYFSPAFKRIDMLIRTYHDGT
jgi:aspartyl-tRNA(Asn)/glutamyl-tRNA(Gln) amidotransferase subunit A